jgi:hypothetical protein
MSATRATSALHGGRWGVFGVRYAIFTAYNVAAFATKPGSRLICPALACLAAWWWRSPLEAQLFAATYQLDVRSLTATDYTVAGVVAVCVCVALSAHRYRARRAVRFAGGVMRFALQLAFVVGMLVFIAYAAGVQLPTLASVTALVPHIGGVNVGPWDVALALCVIVASCVYVCLSKLLTVLLGAFPVVTRPLRPLKPLKAANRVIRSMRVSVVVPRLPMA